MDGCPSSPTPSTGSAAAGRRPVPWSRCSAAPGCRPSPASPTTGARTGAARQVHPDDVPDLHQGRGRTATRYWARSHLGWGRIARAEPNAGHRGGGRVSSGPACSAGSVTQNVDGLHQRAGAADVLELHGNLARVGLPAMRGPDEPARSWTTGCARPTPAGRARAAAVNPDGDVELADARPTAFVVVDCLGLRRGAEAGRRLLRRERSRRPGSQRPSRCVERSRALLVLGSSLTVMSGRRFVLRAAALGTPVAIVNQGATRGDPYAGLVVGRTARRGCSRRSSRAPCRVRQLGCGSMIGGTGREGRRP